MTVEEHLLYEFQRLSGIAREKRTVLDRAIKELVEAERAAEHAGCALDAVQQKAKR